MHTQHTHARAREHTHTLTRSPRSLSQGGDAGHAQILCSRRVQSTEVATSESDAPPPWSGGCRPGPS